MKRVFVIVSLLFLMFLSSCKGKKDAVLVDEEPSALPVEGLTVSVGRLVNEVRSAGVVEGVREAWIVSKTEGIIRNVFIALGDSVRVGQLLVTVDGDLAKIKQEVVQQQLETIQLEAVAAKVSLKNGSISQVQFSKINDRLLAAVSAVEQATDNYNNTRLTAPIGGLIAAINNSVSVGNYLSRSIKAIRIVDNSSFKADVSVGEGEVVKIREGDEAEVMAADGIVRAGVVKAISAGSNSNGSFTVLVSWSRLDEDVLRSGMSVDVAIKINRGEPVVIMPASVLRTRKGSSFVFVDSGGKAKLRKIRIGSRLGERLEVLDGLNVGDKLITTALGSLEDGMDVKTSITGESGNVE